MDYDPDSEGEGVASPAQELSDVSTDSRDGEGPSDLLQAAAVFFRWRTASLKASHCLRGAERVADYETRSRSYNWVGGKAVIAF